MKRLTVCIALFIPTLAFSSESIELDCQKGAGKCADQYPIQKGQPDQTVTLKCIDGSKIHNAGVSTPAVGVTCENLSREHTDQIYSCNGDQQPNVSYLIKAHLECK